jgi:hypothetical protein
MRRVDGRRWEILRRAKSSLEEGRNSGQSWRTRKDYTEASQRKRKKLCTGVKE